MQSYCRGEDGRAEPAAGSGQYFGDGCFDPRQPIAAGGCGGAGTGAVVEIVTPGTGGTDGGESAPAATKEVRLAQMRQEIPRRIASRLPVCGARRSGSPAVQHRGTQRSGYSPAPPASSGRGREPGSYTDHDGNGATDSKGDAATTTAPAQNADGTKTDATQTSGQSGTDTSDQKESSSKKKKGLRKILPW